MTMPRSTAFFFHLNVGVDVLPLQGTVRHQVVNIYHVDGAIAIIDIIDHRAVNGYVRRRLYQPPRHFFALSRCCTSPNRCRRCSA